MIRTVLVSMLLLCTSACSNSMFAEESGLIHALGPIGFTPQAKAVTWQDSVVCVLYLGPRAGVNLITSKRSAEVLQYVELTESGRTITGPVAIKKADGRPPIRLDGISSLHKNSEGYTFIVFSHDDLVGNFIVLDPNVRTVRNQKLTKTVYGGATCLSPSGNLVICNLVANADHGFTVVDQSGSEREMGDSDFYSAYRNAPNTPGRLLLTQPAVVWMTDENSLWAAGPILDISRGAVNKEIIEDLVAVCRFDLETGHLSKYSELRIDNSKTVCRKQIQFAGWKAFANRLSPSTIYGSYVDADGTGRMFVVELDEDGTPSSPAIRIVEEVAASSANYVSNALEEFRFFERRGRSVWMTHVVRDGDRLLYSVEEALYD